MRLMETTESFIRCCFLVILTGTGARLSVVVTVPEVVTVVELDPVNVSCSADYTIGDTSPRDVEFVWTRPSSRQFIRTGSDLFIGSTFASEHGGNYTCSLYSRDQHELIGAATLRLVVQHEPRWDQTLVKTRGADVGSVCQLLCLVHAEPLPVQFYWTTPNGVNIISSLTSRGFELTSSGDRSVLVVLDVRESDYGNYKCVARNLRGERSFDLRLQRPGPPDSPLECSPTPTSGTTVTVECTVGYDGGRPVSYVVYAIPRGSATAVSCRDGTTAGPIRSLTHSSLSDNKFRLTVEKLKPRTKYDMHIYAQNDHGCSSVSFSVPVETEDSLAEQSSSVMIKSVTIAVILLVVVLTLVFAFNRFCRRRHQRNEIFRPRRSFERSTSRRNLISSENTDVIFNDYSDNDDGRRSQPVR